MKKILFSILFASTVSVTAFAQNSGVLNADLGEKKISRHIYGHFAEHLGRCVYDGFYVGESAGIPHTDGVRKDIIEALRQLKVPNLRWPGGCFADAYHWKDGVGPRSKRPPMLNHWWGGVEENNHFGTHEFLNLCEAIGAEPYLAGNVGSGTVQELNDWVQYVNAKPNLGPMARWRAENGRQQPWNVKYWGVGNESWGCGGNMKPEYYANLYKHYATYIADWSNTGQLYRVVSGSNSSDYNWTEVMMREIPLHMMDGLSLHHYSVIDWGKKGSATQFDEALYFKTMQEAHKMDEIITRHATIMDKYDPAKKVGLIVDEWGGWYDVEPGTNTAFLYQQNTMRDAMIAGLTLNIFNKHCSRVTMANLAQTVNVLQAVILTDKEKMLLTPTYHVMKMYSVHQDATLLPLQITTSDYMLGSQKLPAISASASLQSDGTTHISLVNIDYAKPHTITIDLRGKPYKSIAGTILKAGRVQDHNTFEKPDLIKPAPFEDARLSGSKLTVTLPAFAVVVLALK